MFTDFRERGREGREEDREREREREREGEREMDRLPPMHALTGDEPATWLFALPGMNPRLSGVCMGDVPTNSHPARAVFLILN